jgi:hypothetical protein
LLGIFSPQECSAQYCTKATLKGIFQFKILSFTFVTFSIFEGILSINLNILLKILNSAFYRAFVDEKKQTLSGLIGEFIELEKVTGFCNL